MAVDLYATLGVDRTADKAEMRRAYRRKAKSAHPDAGGSAAAFHRLKTALSVLSDDARRQRYDQTGEVDEGQPLDQDLARRLEVLGLILSNALDTMIPQGRDPETGDMLWEMRASVAKVRHAWTSELKAFEKADSVWAKVDGRFSQRKADQPNRIGQIITGQREQLRYRRTAVELRLKALDEVQAMLDDYSYRRDAVPNQTVPQPGLWNLLGAMGQR